MADQYHAGAGHDRGARHQHADRHEVRRIAAGRRTNLTLLGALAVALGSGGLAFALGSGWGRWAVAAHGAAGIALLLLSPWKSAIVRHGLARRRPRPGRSAGIALAVLLVVVVATGFGHSTGLLRQLGPLTAMQVHVGAALLAVVPVLWHVRVRPQRPHRTDFGRRALLRAGALAAVATLAWGGTEALERLARMPGGARRFTGSYAAGSFDPPAMPVTQWLDDAVPEIDPSAWRLRVRAGASVREWSYAELTAFSDRVRATIDCTGGWYAEQDWEGAWLDRLLPDGVAPDGVAPGRSAAVISVTGYGRRFPAGERLLIATRVGGRPLTPGHGFPVRIVAPGRRGFWWVKWVESVELQPGRWWAQPPFPLS